MRLTLPLCHATPAQRCRALVRYLSRNEQHENLESVCGVRFKNVAASSSDRQLESRRWRSTIRNRAWSQRFRCSERRGRFSRCRAVDFTQAGRDSRLRSGGLGSGHGGGRVIDPRALSASLPAKAPSDAIVRRAWNERVQIAMRDRRLKPVESLPTTGYTRLELDPGRSDSGFTVHHPNAPCRRLTAHFDSACIFATIRAPYLSRHRWATGSVIAA